MDTSTSRTPTISRVSRHDGERTRVAVPRGAGAARYRPAARPGGDDTWALRDLRPGELIPAAGVGPARAVTVQQVALLVDATSASALTPGSVVDVYVNRPVEGTTVGLPSYAGPERALERVAVVRVAADDGVLAGSAASRAVHVMVPREDVQSVVADVDLGARITLVPVPGGVAAAGS